MLKQIKTLGIALVMGTMLVGCDSEVENIEIEDTNPVKQEQQVEEKVEKQEPIKEKKEEKIDKETYLNNLENSGKQVAVILMEQFGIDELNEQHIFDNIKGTEEVNEYTFKDDINACRLAIIKGLIEGGNVNIKPEEMLAIYNYMIENDLYNVSDYYKIMKNNEEEKEQPKEVKNENIYDVKVLDMIRDTNVRYEYLSNKEIKTIEKLMPEFIELGKEHAEIFNNEKGEEYKYFKYDEVYALAKTYENEFEHDYTFTYLFAAYRLAFTDYKDITEDLTECFGHAGKGACDQMMITDKYTEILRGYPSEVNCGCCGYEGEYIKDHSITAEEVYEVLDKDLNNGYEVVEETENEIVVKSNGMFENVYKINLNNRHVN